MTVRTDTAVCLSRAQASSRRALRTGGTRLAEALRHDRRRREDAKSACGLRSRLSIAQCREARMRHSSASFNKRSRLIIAPPLASEVPRRLAAPDGATLRARLVDALQVQQDFFPCFDWVFPPPVFPKAPGPGNAKDLSDGRAIVPGTYSIYVHIPFCSTLCSFCYFRVLPGRGSEDKALYVDYLLREMAMYRESLQGQRCESIYIGGGTPTTLEDDHLIRVFSG